MKPHEKKAIVSALEWLSAGVYDKDYKVQSRRDLALEAVELAQMRAGRKYDRETYEAAVSYGIKLMGGGV